MIEKIILHNFQCHKDVTLELGRSTVLLGDSDCGKSAVLRALYWVIYNNPLIDRPAPQNFYVSYWAQKKTKSGFKFKDDEYTSVTVIVDGHTIERKRSNTFNGYYVDGVMYEALRTNVPEEVTNIFNIASASVQQQMDSPFLLTATPGEASQYLNSLAHLECVDEILTIAKKKALDTSAKVDSTNEEIAQLEKEISTYGWVSKAEVLYDKATKLTPKIEKLKTQLDAINKTIAEYKSIPNYPEIPKWLEGKDFESQINKLQMDIDLVNRYIGACKVINSIAPTLRSLSRLKEPRQLDFGKKDILALGDDIADYKEALRLGKAWTKVSALKEPKQSKYTERQLDNLSKSIEDYADARRSDRKYNRILNALGSLEKPRESKWTEKDIDSICRDISDFKKDCDTIMTCVDSLDELYNSLAGVACPVCGRPLDKDTCLL